MIGPSMRSLSLSYFDMLSTGRTPFDSSKSDEFPFRFLACHEQGEIYSPEISTIRLALRQVQD